MKLIERIEAYFASVRPETWLRLSRAMAGMCACSVVAGVSLAICVALNGMDGQLSMGLAICIFAAIQELIFGSLFAIFAELKIDTKGERK